MDAFSGDLVAIIDGGALTALRTGAAGGVAARVLSRTGASHAALFGAGVQARSQLLAVATVRPIREVRLVTRDPGHAVAFIAWADAATIEAATQNYPRVEFVTGVKHKYPLGYDIPADGSLAPQYVLERLGKIVGPDAVYVAGVGQHQMWASHYVGYEKPRSWINSGGLGTMGFSVPAAMGAKVGRPDVPVWSIDGDGCFQMTNQELATCALENIPIKVAIINNESLGMVRQWQTLFYDKRYSNTDLQRESHRRIPDFVKLADAYGCVGLACDAPDDVDATIEKAMEINDVPVVVDFRVHRDAMVWPMVAAGTSNDDIKFARDLAPEFDEDDL